MQFNILFYICLEALPKIIPQSFQVIQWLYYNVRSQHMLGVEGNIFQNITQLLIFFPALLAPEGICESQEHLQPPRDLLPLGPWQEGVYLAWEYSRNKNVRKQMMLSDPPPRVKTSRSARAGSSTEAWCQLTSQRKAPHCQRLFSEPPSREVSSQRSQKWLHPPCQTDRIREGRDRSAFKRSDSFYDWWSLKTHCVLRDLLHGMVMDLEARAPSGRQPSRATRELMSSLQTQAIMNPSERKRLSDLWMAHNLSPCFFRVIQNHS